MIKKIQKMINFDYITKENVIEHDSNWPEISELPYSILIIWGSVSRKTYPLFNLKGRQQYIDKIYLHTKDPYKAKYQLWFMWEKAESTSKFCKKDHISLIFGEISKCQQASKKDCKESQRRKPTKGNWKVPGRLSKTQLQKFIQNF